MRIEDTIIKLRSVAYNLKEQYGRQLADEITNEAITRIQNRTIRGGTGYTGYKYTTHSQKPMNAYYSKSCGRVREKAGRTTGMRNYYFTGEMLGSLGRTRYIPFWGGFEIWIQGRGIHKRNKGTIPNKELLTIHSEDQGVNLLGLNPEELKAIAKKLEVQLEILMK